METLYPSSFMSNSTWLLQENHNTEWTREENKQFERALAIYDKETSDRWLNVAAMIPGKTVVDVIKRYEELLVDVCEIEAGRVPIPGYLASPFTIELVGNQNYDAYRKRPATVRGADQERKKGVPWTEDEHKYVIFMINLKFSVIVFLVYYGLQLVFVVSQIKFVISLELQIFI